KWLRLPCSVAVTVTTGIPWIETAFPTVRLAHWANRHCTPRIQQLPHKIRNSDTGFFLPCGLGNHRRETPSRRLAPYSMPPARWHALRWLFWLCDGSSGYRCEMREIIGCVKHGPPGYRCVARTNLTQSEGYSRVRPRARAHHF